MSVRLTTERPRPFELSPSERALLARRVERASARARSEQRRVVAAVTVPVAPNLDVSAAVLAARRPSDRLFCMEHPAREGFALATLGQAAVIEASGDQRFDELAAAARALTAGAAVGDAAEDPSAPPAAGPVLVGGFAFAAGGGASPEWAPFAPALLVLPELALVRYGPELRMTVALAVDGDQSVEALLAQADARLEALRPAAMPLLDPHPAERAAIAGAAPPEHYESAVARAVERIRAGELEKVVLAREVRVHTPMPVDAGAVLGALRDVFPECYCYCVGTPDAAFVGASPELLVRRDGARAQTVALAGSARRSADPAVDGHLGERLLRSQKDREEQAIVARGIERRLEPLSVWTAAADEPALVKVQNVQHLATPVRAQLAEPVPLLELASLLHPTPAVGGEPGARALEVIPALEGLDRGWYAGAVGFMDFADDGELCVALRCALLRGTVAHLYAGAGIVRDSDPGEELAETELKLQALLPLLT